MIIDAKAVLVTLLIVVVAFVYGLKFIRKFALEIAQENHDAVTAIEQEEEQKRMKKQRAADAAADIAFAKVEPILNIPKAPSKAPLKALPKAPLKAAGEAAAEGEP